MSTSTSTTTNELYYTPQTTITDPLFLQGLSSILVPYYERKASPEEIQQVTERAQSFYLSSQATTAPPPSQAIESLTSVPPIAASSPSESSADSPSTTTTSLSSDDPPYPLSFAHLAHLISTGAPIPGIRDIPDKLAEETPTESKKEIQRKPWERENVEAEEEAHDRKEGEDSMQV